MPSNPSPLSRPKPAPPSLALRPKDAAKALGIGERLLWDLTAPRGPIPCVRLGNAVTYPIHLLEKWLAAQARQSLELQQPGGVSVEPKRPSNAVDELQGGSER